MISPSPTFVPSSPVGDNKISERLGAKGSLRMGSLLGASSVSGPCLILETSENQALLGPGFQVPRKLTGLALTVTASMVVAGWGRVTLANAVTVCRCTGPFNKSSQMLEPVSALSMLPW